MTIFIIGVGGPQTASDSTLQIWVHLLIADWGEPWFSNFIKGFTTRRAQMLVGFIRSQKSCHELTTCTFITQRA
jgi:hypothetical protein